MKGHQLQFFLTKKIDVLLKNRKNFKLIQNDREFIGKFRGNNVLYFEGIRHDLYLYNQLKSQLDIQELKEDLSKSIDFKLNFKCVEELI